MKTKIEVNGKQVKVAPWVKGREPRPSAEEKVKLVPLKVKGSGRAKVFRELAMQMRTLGMLLDAAAAGEEEQARKLSALVKERRSWRRALKQAKASAAKELPGSLTLQ